MNVEELQAQLKLVKNKKVDVVFKSGNSILEPTDLLEVVKEGNSVRYPKLGEVPNILLINLPEITNE